MSNCAFTVKILGQIDAVPSDYEPVFLHWKKRGFKVSKVFWETDSRGLCHGHGTIDVPHHYYRMKLAVHGFHMHFVPIFDQDGWDKYCVKQLLDKPDTLKVTIIRNPYDTCQPTSWPQSLWDI